MSSVQSLGRNAGEGTLRITSDPAADLLERASLGPGGLDVDGLKASLDQLSMENPALAAQMREQVAQKLSVTQQAELDRPTRSNAEAPPTTLRLEGLNLTRDQYLASAAQLWSQMKGEKSAGFANDRAVQSAARAVAAAPTTATSDVIADQPTRDFVVSIARATAQARIGGRDQEYEKFVVVGRGADGGPVVKAIGLVGKQGGSIPAQRGDVIVHEHYRGLVQPPNAGDSSAAKAGRSSFVLSDDGRNVWEVGRVGGEIQVRSVGANGRTDAWQDYQADPSRYRGY